MVQQNKEKLVAQDGYYLLSFLICNQNEQFSPVEGCYCKGQSFGDELKRREMHSKRVTLPICPLFINPFSISDIPFFHTSCSQLFSTFITFQVLLTLVLRGIYNIELILNRTVSLKTFPNLEILYYIQYSTRQRVP